MRWMLVATMLGLLAPVGARADLYRPYAAVLQDYVDDMGLVNYGGLHAAPDGLNAFVQSLAALDSTQYGAWTQPERLAFWINAYNALTLKLIVDNYPIHALAGREKYPASSIQQIPSPWSRPRYEVMGKKRSLDDIEHNIIRAGFHEPRVHMALVCAARSCPPLRREPYVGSRLDQQLDDQTRRFFSELTNLQIDRDKNEVFASRILDWFAEDFAPGAIEEKGQRAGKRMALIAAAGPYVDAETRAFLEAANFHLEYFDYDWALNEQFDTQPGIRFGD